MTSLVVLPSLSPSQHEALASCPRKWGFRSRDRLKAPQKKAAANGTAVHALLERYYKERSMPPASDVEAHRWLVAAGHVTAEQVPDLVAGLGEIAMSGLPHIPTPRDDLGIEHEFTITRADVVRAAERAGELADLARAWPEGLAYVGVVDVYDVTRSDGFRVGAYAERDPEPQGWSPLGEHGEPFPLIIDHKTTSNLEYMKTDAILRGTDSIRADPQPAIYGLRALLDHLETYTVLPREVHFRWVYYVRKKGARARPVDVRMTPAEIAANVAAYLDDARFALDAHARGLAAADLPGVPSACSKFGGCEYGPQTRSGPGNLNVCRLSPGQAFRSAMQPPISLSQLVQQATSGAPAASAPSGVFSAPTPSAPPAPSAPAGGVFSPPTPSAPPAPSRQPPIAAGVFSTDTASVRPTPTPAPTPPVTTPSAGVFGVAATTAPASIPDPLAAFLAPPPPAPAPAPAPQAIAPGVPPERVEEWLALCAASNLDPATGQPRGTLPATLPTVAPVPQPAPEMIGNLRVEQRPTGTVLVQGPPETPAPAVEAAPKRRGRPRGASGEATMSGEGLSVSAEGPTVVVAVISGAGAGPALEELVSFLRSMQGGVQ